MENTTPPTPLHYVEEFSRQVREYAHLVTLDENGREKNAVCFCNRQHTIKSKDFPLWDIFLPPPKYYIALMKNKESIIRVEYKGCKSMRVTLYKSCVSRVGRKSFNDIPNWVKLKKEKTPGYCFRIETCMLALWRD